MTRPVAVLRPEPGNRATALGVEAAGGRAIRLPLFAVAPVAWQPPAADRYDALLLTSANAVRHGGAALAGLAALPVYAVGAATARAAAAMGFAIAHVGDGDAATLRAELPPSLRLIHLAGRDRVALPGIDAITVYAADPLPDPDVGCLAGSVAMLHSARAARRLAALVALPDRVAIRLAAIGDPVAAAAGSGWHRVAAAATPDDAALVGLALRLAGDSL